MKFNVLLFAGLRDAAGSDSIDVELTQPIVAGDLIQAIAVALPQAESLVRHSRLAIDGTYINSDGNVETSSAEFALIPPVSGG
ncbi:MoaD/ThiS family protein [Rhodopirellula sp. MGV]|uniref:MoaD/ThiS family protein n=1 Tax=Rhodopirellula sp. MGV TaxID=2023130 RepID=UPI000B96CE8F|nr:MoaD/ThiS family protein [Rhodopirellula sp. MGV]OYP35185.1 hypothetical protein CGZ80_12355 [Rhodopirellula sp. MGV]PNY37801.1 MoaD/ThiS family protein [Rhodopirellula baltica]